MKENPEDEFEPESPGNESPDFSATTSPGKADFSDAQNSDEGPYRLEPAPELETNPAEFLHASSVVYTSATPARPLKPSISTAPIAADLGGIAANGGAVGAVVLGIWSILGSLLTYWSIINGILGLVLGVWGLTSKRPRTAWIGIFLSLIGTVLSTISVGELITNYWDAAKDTYGQ